MLDFDPEKRFDMEQVLSHRWWMTRDEAEDIVMMGGVDSVEEKKEAY